MFYSETSYKDEQLRANQGTTVRVENVSVKGGEMEAGTILCGTSGIYEPVTKAADANKSLVILSADYNSTDAGVVSAFTSGSFHEKILKTGASAVTAADFKDALRKYSIVMTEGVENND